MAAPPPLLGDSADALLSAPSPLSGGALPRIVAAATAALESGNSRSDDDDGGGLLSGLGGSTTSLPGATTATATAVVRLKKTLQQVAVHRVQQIYARLNGALALEAAASTPGGSGGGGGDGGGGGAPGGSGGIADHLQDGRTMASAAGVGEEDERLESEAREMVAFACGACASSHGDGRGEGGAEGCSRVTTTWGDESRAARDGASWSMMMPYLPVWVGFAAREQVRMGTGRWAGAGVSFLP